VVKRLFYKIKTGNNKKFVHKDHKFKNVKKNALKKINYDI
jgi:hypothetical protein